MRLKSLADLGNIDTATPQAKQLQAALDAYKKDARRLQQKAKSRSPAAVGVSSFGPRRGAVRQPQDILSAMVMTDQDLSGWHWEEDYVGAVPGRKFELDLAVPTLRLGVEVDGWQYHGQHKESFLRDRDKDYLLSLQGWVIVRVQAGLVSSDPGEALERVRRFMTVWGPRQRQLLEG